MNNEVTPCSTNRVMSLTHRLAMEEAARCLLCYDAPCDQACPAGTQPAEFIRAIRFRNDKGAAEIIRENNVLGGVCAYVCPVEELCEGACTRSQLDRPVAIAALQRYAVEQERAFGMSILRAPEVRRPERIACVGAGPASLACAAQLARAGFQVTVFEREAKAGGVPSLTIAPSRLPQDVVDFDVAQLGHLGIKFEYGKDIGATSPLDTSDYDAVFIGTGLWRSGALSIPGLDLPGVVTAIDFLRQARADGETPRVGSRVVVVGGGDVAVDCAITARAIGASEVRMVFREPVPEHPAHNAEIAEALADGVAIIGDLTPTRIVRLEAGLSISFASPDGGTELTVAADTVILAVGQTARGVGEIAPVELTARGKIVVDANRRTSVANVFAGGDIVDGSTSVVAAVRDGKLAAAAIAEFLDAKTGGAK